MTFHCAHWLALLAQNRTFWMPPQASTFSPEVDWVFYFIFYISVFFFLLIVALAFFMVIRYRRRPGVEVQSSPSHNTALEIVWSIIPIIIVVLIFFFGFRGFANMAFRPSGSYDIQVEAQKWSWSFRYPNGYVDKDLHVPKDQPVVLTMKSLDVIHSFFVPQFRIKRDVVPGRYNKVWFEASQAGTYDVFCAEYCGTEHSNMHSLVVVHEPGEFEQWMENAANYLATLPPEEAGAQLFQKRGCNQCHSVDGSAATGPTLKGIFGHEQPLQRGATALVDENYLRESMLNPSAKIVAGFDNVMPTYQGRLKEEEIDFLIAYIKSLSGAANGSEKGE